MSQDSEPRLVRNVLKSLQRGLREPARTKLSTEAEGCETLLVEYLKFQQPSYLWCLCCRYKVELFRSLPRVRDCFDADGRKRGEIRGSAGLR